MQRTYLSPVHAALDDLFIIKNANCFRKLVIISVGTGLKSVFRKICRKIILRCVQGAPLPLKIKGKKTGLKPLPQVHYQQFRLGHLFNRILQAFAAQSGVFNAAIRHLINAERWHIASDNRAHFQFFIGLKQ